MIELQFLYTENNRGFSGEGQKREAFAVSCESALLVRPRGSKIQSMESREVIDCVVGAGRNVASPTSIPRSAPTTGDPDVMNVMRCAPVDRQCGDEAFSWLTSAEQRLQLAMRA